jgi:hypothetical protein
MFYSINWPLQTNIDFPPLIPIEETFYTSFDVIREISNNQQKQNRIQSNKEGDNAEKAEKFLIEISGALPRKTLIRKLLLLIFPKGLELISIRKICRAPLNDLLCLIGMYLDVIKSSLTNNILDQYMKICLDQLSKTQRNQKNDSTVLSFTRGYLEKNQKKSQSLIPSISHILKELDPEFNYQQKHIVQI